MTYSEKQIENAKANYTSFLKMRTVESYEPQYIGYAAAEQRCEFHNNVVTQILNGNKDLEKEWKLFFLNEQVKSDNKIAESKAKLASNKEASSEVLVQVKSAGKNLGDYYKWLNNRSNQFRKEFFSKKYSQTSVSLFISL